MRSKLKLGAVVLLLLIACALLTRAQSWSGQSSGDTFIVPPYRMCFGPDDGGNACFIKSAANAIKLNGVGGVLGSLSVGAFSATSQAVNGDTVATLTASQTLTNKALTSPTITNPSTTGTDSGSEILQNKTLNGTSNGNAVTLLNFQAGGSPITGNSADQTLYTFTINANQVGAGKGIRVSAGFLHGLGSASITYKLILGATTVCTYSAAGASLTENWQFEIINNPGVQNAQTARSTVFDGLSVVGCFSNNWTTAENLANSDTIKATFNVANTDQVTPKFWMVELIQ